MRLFGPVRLFGTPEYVIQKHHNFRREGWGNHYLCGRSPTSETEEPDITTPDVDYDFFDEKVWPVIANRAKCFENIKVNYAI